MGDRPLLSKGEMEVARALWKLGKGTVRQVHEALSAGRKIEFTTVQTYLRRLDSKGYVRTATEGRTLVYSPRVRPATVIRETLSELVDRLFGGETLSLVRYLIEDRGLDVDDLAELKRLIESLERETARGKASRAKGGAR